MGVIRSITAALVVIAAVASSAPAADAPIAGASRFLVANQSEDGGFAEAGRVPDAQLTAWVALGLVAAGTAPEARLLARSYLRTHEAEADTPTERALHVLARAALDDRATGSLADLRAYRPGRAVNATIWTILALREAGEKAPPALVRSLLAAQGPSGGWSWAKGLAPDSNDTAAAVQALRAAGIRGASIDRGIAYLARLQSSNGGFALVVGRPPDTQSTAWAIQAYIAAGRSPGAAPFRFLARMRRADGSYRYSAAYATTPVWVTAQTLAALAGKQFPIRSR